jgi:hypothetical protein
VGTSVVAGYSKEEARKCLTWLPRQEDWQEKYEQEKGQGSSMVKFESFLEINYHTTPLGVEGLSLKERYTIAWCLFVSKEVYGLEWSWDKNVWRKR